VWHPQTVDELIDTLFKDMMRSFSYKPEDKEFEWTLSFIRVSSDGQVCTGLHRKQKIMCLVYAPGTPDHDKTAERIHNRTGPSGRFGRLHKNFLSDCNTDARDKLRAKLVEAGIKLIPCTDNPTKLY